MNFKPAPGQGNVAFPKLRKVKRRTGKTPESALQTAVEQYLDIKGLRWLHIPSSIYRLCSLSAPTPLHIKREISDHLKSVPDLLVFKGGSFLGVELKRKNAKARQGQRAWMKGLNCHVVDNFEQARELIDAFSGD